jgi:hypothetical protein
MAFIPLIATGASIAYDQISGTAERESYANKQADLATQDLDFRMKSWEEQKALIQEQNDLNKGAYDFAVSEYNRKSAVAEAKLAEPTYKYNQDVVNSNVELVKQQLDKQMATQRPQILENLSTRGVRTSGISESALAPINKSYTEGLATATTQATLAELLAQRTAEAQRQADILKYYGGVSQPTSPTLSQYPSTPDTSSYYNTMSDVNALPLYNQQITANYINQLGSAAGYAYNNWGNDTLNTNLYNRSSKLNAEGYNP